MGGGRKNTSERGKSRIIIKEKRNRRAGKRLQPMVTKQI
jgi:hypothetical protein